MKDFDPRIVIETDRLVLRYMEETDTRDIFNNINSDKEVLKYFIDKYVEKAEDMTLGRVINYCLENHRYLFAIERKDTHKNKIADDGKDHVKAKPVKSKKVGRNDPCPCGSGKKYKQCHGK